MIAFLGPEEHQRLRLIGRALITTLDAILPNAETNASEKALMIAAGVILKKAVYARFGVTGSRVMPIDVPDRPPT